jgi:hypothetical protein
MRYTERIWLVIGGRMTRSLCILVVLGSLAAGPAPAANAPAENSKGGSKAERALENTGKTLGKTADRAEKSVKQGLGRTEKAINTAGEKTGRWLNEKTK